MSFKYTVVCDTLSFVGHNILDETQEILQTIKEVGYDGADLPSNPDKMNANILRPIVESVGLEVPELLGAWAYFHGGEDRDMAGENEEARARGIDYAKKSIELCKAMGARFYQVCATQPPVYQYGFPRTPIPKMRKNFLRALEEIVTYGAQYNITILLEPLNGYEAYPGILTSVYEARDIIDELGFDNMGIQPDVHHMNISEGPMLKALRDVGPYIKHIHMNETNHYSLGSGHADYPGIIRVLKDIDYQGFLAFYMPMTTQEVFYLTSERCATSEASGVAKESLRPELKPLLEMPLNYLKQIENTLDSATKTYGI